MRRRLEAVLISLIVVLVAAMALPLLLSQIEVSTQRVLADRSADAQRFASVTQQVSTQVDEQALLAELQQYYRVHEIDAAVYDRDASIRMSVGPRRSWADAEVRSHAEAALHGQRSVTSAQFWPWTSQNVVVAEPVVIEGDVVGAVVTVSQADRLRLSLAWLMVLLATGVVVALIGGVVVASKITTWILKPVLRLENTAHEIGAGHPVALVPSETGPPELRHLARSFNDMAARVQAAADRQRAFVADASHQLRNPLNALLLRLEQLELALRPGHERDHEHVRADAKRLARILDDLLQLARVEGVLDEPKAVDVTAMVSERVAAWQAVAQSRAITLSLRLRTAATAWIAPTALGGALDAVIDNALKFTPSDGTVEVIVGRDNHAVVVVVEDDGPGLCPEEMNLITDRFWRSQRHQNVPGTGLGLSISRALLGHYGARIEVTASQQGGLAVNLLLRAAREGNQGLRSR